jgi:uncharacterized surface protein with fasciclin (FAS1) repeats
MLKTLTLTAALIALPGAALADDCNYKTKTADTASAATIHLAGYGKGDSYAAKPDIVDTAASDSQFSTLVAAVKAAGLVDTLKSDGPFTVFAPTNDAFAALPAGTVESLLLPENKDQLTAILTYHVVPGKVKAGDLSDGLSAATAQGESVTFDLSDGAKVNGVNIIATDIKTSNGVIHVIDSVLLPPAPMTN